VGSRLEAEGLQDVIVGASLAKVAGAVVLEQAGEALGAVQQQVDVAYRSDNRRYVNSAEVAGRD